MRRLLLLIALVALALPAAGVQAKGKGTPPSPAQRTTLQAYAAATWHSFVMMTNPQTGLTADNVSAEGVRAKYTSPTNIASYIWSALSARDVGVLKPQEARDRIAVTLRTLARLERSHGEFYNWYDPDTGERLRVWPANGSRVYGFLSTVDNGWLAASLLMVERAVPQLRQQADAILADMDFGFYYDPAEGQLYGGAWTEPPPDCSKPVGDVWYTCHHYGTLNTEPRITSYIAIARGQVPPVHYYKMFRTFPDTCDWNWQEMQPQGVHRTYEGVDVFEGHYTYRGMNIVPSWGGSMFEALMVPLLVPEEEWAPRSWGVNHPLYVRAQIEHGLQEAQYGFWGFSPSNDPAGGYREYGVDPIGLNPDGYTSDEERTTTDYGFDSCRPAQPQKPFGQGVVTPHASFIALRFAREAALANLEKLRTTFPQSYGPGGFYDAVNVKTGQVSRYHLALDQGMIMLAIANELKNDRERSYIEPALAPIRPLIAQEEFTAGG
jgi:Putative glucoamylase/Protein of unknown function (DUF3131)